MKRKSVALYDPYLDSMGGGERHILSVLEVLERTGEYTPVVFWNEDMNQPIRDKLGLAFHSLEFRENVFARKTTVLDKLKTLLKFNIFIYIPDGSYFFSSARRNYVFCMVPNRVLYPVSWIDKIKTANYSFVSNSRFTQSWLSRWGIQSCVLYPYLNEDYISISRSRLVKDKIILVVGRFFRHLHSKRQDVAIQAFRELKKQEAYRSYRLILAGSVLPSDQEFFMEVRNLAEKDEDIEFHINPPLDRLVELYKRARFYWHFAGFGIDPHKEPQNVEHLGITPLEAMAAGCVVCCYAAGGPQELISHGKNGYLFTSINSLLAIMQEVRPEVEHDITTRGQAFVRARFSYDYFSRAVLEQFAPEL